jgi:3-oxoacyl-[acyl-carrier protein] reductase
VVAEAGFANHGGKIGGDCTERFIASPEAEARSTAMIPNGRIGEPDAVAAAIAYLLSAQATHVSGQVLRVNGRQAVLRPLRK